MQKVEPEERELRQDAALVRDPGGENMVEGRDAVCRNKDQIGVLYQE